MKTPTRARPTICPVLLVPEELGDTGGRLLFGGADIWRIGDNAGNIAGGNPGGCRSCEWGVDAGAVCSGGGGEVIRKTCEGGIAVGVEGRRNSGGGA